MVTEFLKHVDLDLLVLCISAVVFLGMMINWHTRPNNSFDLKDTFVDKSGTLSLSKLGQMIAMLVSTWIIIYQTRHNLLTEWLFTGYMLAWAGANVAHKWLDQKESHTKSVDDNVTKIVDDTTK
jgi:hypothetical protein